MIVLEEKTGYKYYNGEDLAIMVYLPDNGDASVWNLITDEEAEKIKEEKSAKIKEENNDIKPSEE